MENWDQTILWTLSTLIFFALKPIWIKKRSYFIAAGIIFFTPMLTYYPGITGYYSGWPLIGALPSYLVYWDEFHRWWCYVVVPGTVIGVVFWGITVWRKI